MSDDPIDARIRLAAVEHIKRVSAGGVVTADELRAGFFVGGQRIPLINPQRGIFKPASMKHLLSVGTVYPRTGARVWASRQVSAGHIQAIHSWIVPPYATLLVEDTLPKRLKRRTLYIVQEDGYQEQAAMICPCGCHSILHMNLLPDVRPCWRVTHHDDGTATLDPRQRSVIFIHAVEVDHGLASHLVGSDPRTPGMREAGAYSWNATLSPVYLDARDK